MESKFGKKVTSVKNELKIQLGRIKIDDTPLDVSGENPYRQLIFALQKLWSESSKTREEVRAEQHRLVWGRAMPALSELLQGGRDTDKDKIFSKLVTLCILLSGLGSPRSEAVVKETYPALHSVVKAADIGRLIELDRTEKEQHLLELVQIVMGIRLFNKDCRKGGEGIDDLPELLTRAVEATKSQLNNDISSIRRRCEGLTSILYFVYHLDERPYDCSPILTLPSGFTALDIELLKSVLCIFWLQSVCLKELRTEMLAAEVHVLTCVEQLRRTLVQLHETVRYRAAIPTVQVYPLFVQLSLVWRELQYEAAVLSHFSRLLRCITSFADKCPELPMERSFVPPSAQTFSPLRPEEFPHGDLQLKGFCPWTLVQTNGGLVAGCHVEENFAFRSPDAARAWAKNSPHAHTLLQAVISSHPELSLFLKIKPGLLAPSVITESEKIVVETVEVEVQTEVHPVESYKDPDYAWSEWELKKKAVRLARLTLCATKSQQTRASGFRATKGVQCVTTKTRAT